MRAGRVRMNVVPDASAQTLLPWCARNLKVGSLVITDGWPAYDGLENLGYAHRRILQSAKGQKTGAYLPMVHLIVSNLKRWLLGTHKGAVLAHHLPAYLNEFTFRFNRRYWRGPAFHRALGLMVHAATWPEYGMLYGMAKGDPGAWVHPTSPANASPKLKPEADTTVTLPTVTLPVRLPDLGGSPNGTSHQRIDHSRAGFGMAEALLSQLIEQACNGFVLRGIGHSVNSDGQGLLRARRARCRHWRQTDPVSMHEPRRRSSSGVSTAPQGGLAR